MGALIFLFAIIPVGCYTQGNISKQEGVLMKKLFAGLLSLVMTMSLLCGGALASAEPAGDIIILFTNDVHCGIEDDIGYAGLAAYEAACREKTPYVTLVDCGDAIQGDVIGTVSQGEYIVDIMNELDYDYAILGNHEFDYGMERLSELMEKAEAEYLAANIAYTGEGESLLGAMTPYALETYGDTTVAFIGVTTPWSTTSSSPTNFMDESGAFVYDFFSGEEGERLYALVQGYVEECRAAGADYVILLTHLGDTEEMSPYSSVELIENITGVDAVLDGHAHSVIPTRVVADEAGEDVVLVSTGTKLANIGQLVITPAGGVYGGLVSRYEEISAETDAFIQSVKALYEEEVNRVVAHSDTALSGYDSSGIRMVRNRETTIGNLCADAYRDVTGADVAIVNGGGIRADLPAGDITYADIIAIHPYGNTLCMVEATGQEILDALEVASRFTAMEYAGDGLAIGEDGGFLSVSGMRYTIDTAVESTVVMDENDFFVEVDGERRVKNVEVLNGDTGEYEPIDPAATYTLACHNYIIKEGGNGQNMFMDNELLIDEAVLDYEVLINYLTNTLNGELSALYSDVEGRITVK